MSHSIKLNEKEVTKMTKKPAREAYDAALKQAWEAYLAATKQAREAYDAAAKPAWEAYLAALKEG